MDMTKLPSNWAQELNHFKRQYLQLQVTIKYPERQYLKHEVFQNELYAQIFSQEALKYHPPQRYRLRVLKELMKRIEDSITDWEEEVRTISLLSFPLLFKKFIPVESVQIEAITRHILLPKQQL